MKKYLYIVMILALCASVLADSIGIVAPRDQSSVSENDRFSFTVDSVEVITRCDLYVDGELAKSAQYNDTLRGRILTFAMVAEPGPHNWSISCTSASGKEIASAQQGFTLDEDLSIVRITPSGVFRGSMSHEFKFSNTPDQSSVTVPKLAAGDFITILLQVPPSTLKKELYIKQISTKDGVRVMLLEDLKKSEKYTLVQGETVLVNVTTTPIAMTFTKMENNRGVVVVSSTNMAKPQAPETPTQEAEQDTETAPQTPTENPTEDPETPDTPPPDARPGVIKRILRWLTGIFGA